MKKYARYCGENHETPSFLGLMMYIETEVHTYKNLYGEVPHDMRSCSPDKSKFFMRDREIGDVIGDEMLLDRGQVIQLICELLKWLVRGY